MTVTDPYVAIGLRRNPFVVEAAAGVAPDLWIDRGFSQPPPPQARMLVQVIGVRGAGKTAHLKHWQHQTGGPYHHYPPGLGRWQLPPLAPITYWDEADRIPWLLRGWALSQAAAQGATVVVGTHCNLAFLARRVRLRVHTLSLPPLDVPTLLAWSDRRIAAVRLPNTACPLQLSPETAAVILRASGPSLRDAADQLHIWAASMAQQYARARSRR